MSRHVENEIADIPDPKLKKKRPLYDIVKDFKAYDTPFEKLNIYPTQNSLPHANLLSNVLEDSLQYFKHFIRDKDFAEIAYNTNINADAHETKNH
jgi:hypothetical protein